MMITHSLEVNKEAILYKNVLILFGLQPTLLQLTSYKHKNHKIILAMENSQQQNVKFCFTIVMARELILNMITHRL